MEENKQLSVQEKQITDVVQNRIKELETAGNITMPPNYSYSNALKSAFLMLSEQTVKRKSDGQFYPVLQECSKASIANTLFDMCIQGLSPAKKQCYFIPYGGKLQLSKSYLGNIAATKRLKGVKNVYANILYQDDVFEYERDLETGLIKIKKHEQKFENIDDSKIKGAYAVVVLEDGKNYIEIMTMSQIKNAWSQGQMKGQGDVHRNFADQMCKKTVINRACKNFVCTSDDSDLLIETMNRTGEYNEEDIIQTTHQEVKEEIKQEANQGEIIDIPLEEAEKVEAETVIEGQQSMEIKDNSKGDEPF